MIICKEINEYIEYANAHPDWINHKRKLLIKNIVKPTLARNDIFFDAEKFYDCIKYCETNYYPLFPYQKFIYAFAFMYNKLDMPIFPKFLVMMGRGNGKDGFIVPLLNFFQTPIYGVKNYHINIVANAEEQSKDTFDVAYNAMNIQKFKGKFEVTKERIINNATGSFLKYNTSNAKTKDGKKIGALLLNEIHAYENYDQITVFESALGKVKHPREFIITTNGYVRDGPLDDLLKMSTEILESGENPLGYFPFLCELDSKDEMDDSESWHKANPSLEYMPILANQIQMEYLEMKKIPSKKPEFLTKRLNMPAQKEEMAVTSWDNILKCSYSDTERKVPREVADRKGELAIIGIDYADIRDFASAGVLTKIGEEYIWEQMTWICQDSPFLAGIKFPLQNIGSLEFRDFKVVPGPTISIDEILDWCEEKMHEYNVQKVAMDTYRYQLFKQKFVERGISIESKDNPNGLVRLIRRIGSASTIVAPTIETLFSNGNLIYGLSAIMRWYSNNTSVIVDKYGNKTFGKIEPKLRKTDGFMAFVVAFFCHELLDEIIVYV